MALAEVHTAQHRMALAEVQTAQHVMALAELQTAQQRCRAHTEVCQLRNTDVVLILKCANCATPMS
jgi:hypothetical protein